MTRENIPKKIKDALFDEYNHRCAICGSDRPHIHHIDENHANNDIRNLLPLCPNCHLRDQHNPTRGIEIPKLQLFRSYKDPSILKPQFHPIYIRQLFLADVEAGDAEIDDLERQAIELIEFIESLEMGKFYSKRLTELIGPLPRTLVFPFGADVHPAIKQQIKEGRRSYRQKLLAGRETARNLLVEQLRYQPWANGT